MKTQDVLAALRDETLIAADFNQLCADLSILSPEQIAAIARASTTDVGLVQLAMDRKPFLRNCVLQTLSRVIQRHDSKIQAMVRTGLADVLKREARA